MSLRRGMISNVTRKFKPQDPENCIDNDLLFIVTNTGGFDEENCALLQITAMNYFGTVIFDERIRAAKNKTLQERAWQTHGISLDDTKDCPTLDVSIEAFINAIKEKMPRHYAMFAGCSASFSYKFISYAIKDMTALYRNFRRVVNQNVMDFATYSKLLYSGGYLDTEYNKREEIYNAYNIAMPAEGPERSKLMCLNDIQIYKYLQGKTL